MAATWYEEPTVLTCPCPSQPCFGGSKGRARVTGKAGENGQHSGEMGGSSPWTRPSAPECGDTLKAPAGDQSDLGSSMEDPVVPLERNLYGHPLTGLLWERQFEKILLKYVWEKVSNWNAYSYTVKKDYSYLCMWMT